VTAGGAGAREGWRSDGSGEEAIAVTGAAGWSVTGNPNQRKTVKQTRAKSPTSTPIFRRVSQRRGSAASPIALRSTTSSSSRGTDSAIGAFASASAVSRSRTAGGLRDRETVAGDALLLGGAGFGVTEREGGATDLVPSDFGPTELGADRFRVLAGSLDSSLIEVPEKAMRRARSPRGGARAHPRRPRAIPAQCTRIRIHPYESSPAFT
jgi:hypothetical protein